MFFRKIITVIIRLWISGALEILYGPGPWALPTKFMGKTAKKREGKRERGRNVKGRVSAE